MRELLIFLTMFMIAASAGNGSEFYPINPDAQAWASKNWGLINDQNSGVDAPDAWRMVGTQKRIVVAEIDTGIELTHEFISQDVSKFGYDFVKGSNKVYDAHGHGTHIAGIIESVSNSHALIVPIRFYSDANPGSVNLRNTVKAINFAVDHGAKIINYSGGGPEFSEQEYLALKRAEKFGVLVVAAAGNDHHDVDAVENYYYPAAYHLSNIISVMATDINNNPLPSSNWGKTKVDVAAPGENIYSTLPGGRYGYMSGTSQATGFVTGIATMILTVKPGLKPSEVKDIILQSVDSLPQLQDKCVSGGRVNAFKAVSAARAFTRVKP